MNIKLKEINENRQYSKLENENKYEEIHVKSYPTKIILIIFSLIIIFLLFFIFQNFHRKNSNLNKEIMCPTGYKLIDRKCEINYSFKALFYTNIENEKVNIINTHPNNILEMIIDNQKVEPWLFHIFPNP